MTKPVQLPLFDVPTLNVVRPQKDAMNAAAKTCGLSRDEIVERMSDLAERYGVILVKGNGSRLTLDTFEKWINPQDPGRQMPMKALPIFCAVVGNADAMNVMARPLECRVIGAEDVKLLRWAKAYMRRRDASTEMRKIEKEL